MNKVLRNIIETVQKEHCLNTVLYKNELGPGGAYHDYAIELNNSEAITISFQRGPRNEPGSRSGVLDSDLLEIVKHRLESFQKGPFACEENEKALAAVTEALEAMNERVVNRNNRGVLGTSNK